MQRIPLHNRDGDVVAYALVDDEDYEWLSQHKWSANPDGYALSRLGTTHGPLVRMHRLILSCKNDVDHINGNRLDNRRQNLRPATRAQNSANQRPRGGSSKFKGVSWHKKAGKWMAYIMVNYKRVYLGLHVVEEDAARAYDIAAMRLFGEFALTNRKLGLL